MRKKPDEIPESALPPLPIDRPDLGWRVERFRGLTFIANNYICTQCRYATIFEDKRDKHQAKYADKPHPWPYPKPKTKKDDGVSSIFIEHPQFGPDPNGKDDRRS